MWQHQSDELAERQRWGSFFETTDSRPFKTQSRARRNGHLFELNTLGAIMIVVFEVKEWITPRNATLTTITFPIFMMEMIEQGLTASHHVEGGN